MEPIPIIKIPITEEDVEMFKLVTYHNREFDWTFQDSTGRMVNIQFIQEQEEPEEKDKKWD